jgi:broad specificity phosphatase PhoE
MVGVASCDDGLPCDTVFIRHAEASIEPERPASDWPLSPEGKSASRDLGASLVACNLRQLITSPEEKAHATAKAVAEVLRIDLVLDERLREVRRPWIIEDFDGAVSRYLQGETIEGWEPAEQVIERVAAALVSHSSEGPIGVVTHGTAMACFLGARGWVSPVPFWSALTMPDAWGLATNGLSRLYREMPLTNGIVVVEPLAKISRHNSKG